MQSRAKVCCVSDLLTDNILTFDRQKWEWLNKIIQVVWKTYKAVANFTEGVIYNDRKI